MESLNPNPALKQMLQRVPNGSDAQQQQRLREVLQEIALAGLVRRGFFGKAAFYGGTCLRIFHGLRGFLKIWIFRCCSRIPPSRCSPICADWRRNVRRWAWR